MRFCDLILNKEYIVTLHAYDEMAADELTVWDVESAILTGEIIERQKDRHSVDVKYRIRGVSLGGAPMEVIAKLAVTEKLILITVYAL